MLLCVFGMRVARLLKSNYDTYIAHLNVIDIAVMYNAITNKQITVCGNDISGPKEGMTQCYSCGSLLQASNGSFKVQGSGYVRTETGSAEKFTSDADDVIDVDVIE
jgi:hypothetical protein